jgi:hypothetical protein
VVAQHGEFETAWRTLRLAPGAAAAVELSLKRPR